MRRSTNVFLLIFVVLIGIYYYLNNRPEPADIEITEEPAAPIEFLFTSSDGLPARIRIESKAGEVVEVARNAENIWALILPREAAADQGLVEAAASQVTTMRIMDRIPELAPEAAGLNDPEYRMTIRFTSGAERMLEVGVVTPTQSGYYARGDNNEIMIVSKSAVDALLGLLTNPPYAVTETPPPASPEAGPATNSTATPQP